MTHGMRIGITALTVALAGAAVAFVPPGHISAQETACVSTIDLVVVIDGSESISPAQFVTLKSWVGDLTGAFAIGPDDGHAGVVQFAGEGDGIVEVQLTGDADAVQSAIASMTQIIGATDIQEGLSLGQQQFDAFGRAGVPHVLLLLTDGEHNQPGDPYAEGANAEAAGTEIFAVAVGSGPNMDQLNAIASAPSTTHVYSVDAFDELVTILQPLVEVVCPPTPTPVSTGPTPGPDSSDSNDPSSEVLPASLPATGTAMPDDWMLRAGWLSVQALIGVGSAFFLVGAGYWWTRRRVRR